MKFDITQLKGPATSITLSPTCHPTRHLQLQEFFVVYETVHSVPPEVEASCKSMFPSLWSLKTSNRSILFTKRADWKAFLKKKDTEK